MSDMVDWLLAIDPGPEKSAWVGIRLSGGAITVAEIASNVELLDMLRCHVKMGEQHMAIEMVASYGMAVGASVFETCLWVGRFIEAWGGDYTKIYRKDVKLTLCGNARAKDANIRQALIDLYPARGGGKCPQIGTKAKPGLLYGFKADMWSALAVAHTWLAKQGKTAEGGE